MSQLHHSNGPSLPRPAGGSLRFRKATGFTVHKRKADDVESTSTRHHTKIQLDSNRALRLTTERFTVPVPNPVPKTTTPRQDVGNHCQHLSYPEIPKCDDRLPPEVDLGVLHMEPRQSTESVSSRCVG